MKIFIIIVAVIVLAGAGYLLWQQYFTAPAPGEDKVQAELPGTPPASSVPAGSGPTCDQLKDIPSSKYAPAEVLEKFKQCFPEKS